MPELPEVETIVCQLKPLLVKQTLVDVQIMDRERLGGVATLDRSRLPLNRKIEDIWRFGKYIIISFDKSAKVNRCPEETPYLVIHLRMTGRLFWRAQSDPNDSVKGLRALLILSHGLLQFCDVRRFGTFDFCDTLPHSYQQTGDCNPMRGKSNLRLPIDPLDDAFSTSWLSKCAASSAQQVKSWLMRQDRLIGVGNIYASEALFHAKIHPQRLMSSLSEKEITNLRKSIKSVLKKAIKNGGTTFSDFQDTRGHVGRNQLFLKVYDRAGDPCKACGTEIERMTVGGRSTYYCPCCQQLPV